MTDLRPKISVTSININGTDSLIKKKNVFRVVHKANPILWSTQVTYPWQSDMEMKVKAKS